MSFPPANEMFQFAGLASYAYVFSAGYPYRGGFPHSEIPGSKIALISPGLIAECYVLHRLLMPRHPPNALFTLESNHPCAGTSPHAKTLRLLLAENLHCQRLRTIR